MSTPVWLFALIFAAASPFIVDAFQARFRRRVLRRTLEVIERAGLTSPEPSSEPSRENGAKRG
jgi:hypothetical protein